MKIPQNTFNKIRSDNNGIEINLKLRLGSEEINSTKIFAGIIAISGHDGFCKFTL